MTATQCLPSDGTTWRSQLQANSQITGGTGVAVLGVAVCLSAPCSWQTSADSSQQLQNRCEDTDPDTFRGLKHDEREERETVCCGSRCLERVKLCEQLLERER